MERIRKILWSCLGCLLFLTSIYYPARAASGGVVIPPGFRQIDSAVGIELYEKNYPGGSPDFVQVLDLSQGASLKPLHGNITDPGAGKGSYGGNDAHLRSKSLGAYWQELRAQEPSAFCVVNGQFFYMLEYPTRLPFPLKIDGQVLTDGYGILDFPDQKLMLELWPGKADIVPLSREALYASTAPDIIAGLTEEAPKAKKRYTGRTFIGLTGANEEGTFDTLMVFNTKTARQVDAASVLKSFGAQKVMMLDGGGSTQLLCRGKSYIYSDRLIPQAIGIVAGDPGKIQPAAEAASLLAAPAAVPEPANSTADAPAGAIPASEIPAVDKTTTSPNPVVQDQPAPKGDSSNPVYAQANSPASGIGSMQDYLALIFKSPPIAQDPAARIAAVNLANQPADAPSQPAAIEQPATGNLSSVEASGPALDPASAAVTSGQSPSDQPAAKDQPAAQNQAALAAGITPLHLDDVLWVPVSMAPILMFLILAIFKMRGRRYY
jgi:hypothetical protein